MRKYTSESFQVIIPTIWNCKDDLAKAAMITEHICKSFSNSEYTLFTEQKASVVCGIGLTDLKYFLNKMHSDNSNIKLNLQNRTSHFNLGTISYEVPIEVNDLKGAPNADYTVSIPESIVREVLFSIETKGATLAKKRTFTQIRIKNLLIVF